MRRNLLFRILTSALIFFLVVLLAASDQSSSEFELRLSRQEAFFSSSEAAIHRTGLTGKQRDESADNLLLSARNRQRQGAAPLFSSFVGGSRVESSAAIAVGPSGSVVITGQTTSADFPVQNPLFGFSGGLVLGTDIYIAALQSDGSAFLFSTYFGGSSDDIVADLAIDDQGSIYIAGTTASANLPLQHTLYNHKGGSDLFSDGFVTVLKQDGTAVEFSSYFGGTGDDVVTAISIGNDGSIYLTGSTNSDDLPTTPGAYQVSRTDASNFLMDVFVAKLGPIGNMQYELDYASYIGGNGNDVSTRIDVDEEGNAWISGFTSSIDFPMQNPIQDTFAGPIRDGEGDGFLVRISDDGTALDFSTFLGGNQNDQLTGIEIDGEGNVFVTGWTESNNFPATAGSHQDARIGMRDRFLVQLSPIGMQSWAMDYATYLGSPDFEMGIAGLAVDLAGRIWIAGATDSEELPIKDPEQAFSGGGETDAFIARIDADGTTLGFSSYWGGSGSEIITGLAIGDNEVCFTGSTGSSDFPVLNALQPLFDGPAVAGLQSTSAFVSCFGTVNEAPTLAELSVSPDSVGLIARQVQQFSASGIDQFGQPIDVTPQWTATGGSIDASGQYTAGDDAGIFSVTATDPFTGRMTSTIVNIVSGISVEDGTDLPTEFALHANYPNPFNPETTIRFDVKEATLVTLTLYDALGRRLSTLVQENYLPGRYHHRFDASSMASGIYFYEVQMGGFRAVKQMLLVR